MRVRSARCGQLPPHEVLGVASWASLEEINAAFRKRMKAAHPDVKGGTEEEAMAVMRAAEAMRERRKAAASDETLDYDVFDAPPDGAGDAFRVPFVNPFLCPGLDAFEWRALDDAVVAALANARPSSDPATINAAARSVGASPLPGACAYLTPTQKAALAAVLDEAVDAARILDDALATQVADALARARLCELRGGAPPGRRPQTQATSTVADEGWYKERYERDGYR